MGFGYRRPFASGDRTITELFVAKTNAISPKALEGCEVQDASQFSGPWLTGTSFLSAAVFCRFSGMASSKLYASSSKAADRKRRMF
jgi:hypothetical protein